MAHGAPDYSNVSKDGLVYRIDDMGELAVRLGSIVSYDRRGDVIFVEDFSLGYLDIAINEVGAGSIHSLIAGHYESPPFALLLTHNNTIGNYIRYSKRVPRPVGDTLGFAITFSYDALASRIYSNIYYYDGTLANYTFVIFDRETLELYVWTKEDGELLLSDDLSPLNILTLFSHLKIVVNCSTKEIKHVTLNNDVFSLSGKHMDDTATVGSEYIRCSVSAYCNAGVSGSYYIDNIIITTNEP